MNIQCRIPTLTPNSCSYKEFRNVYDRYHVVLFRAHTTSSSDTCSKSSNMNMIHDIFQSMTNEEDRASWCIENEKSKKSGTSSSYDNTGFLRADCRDDGYCSFLVQKDTQVKERLLEGGEGNNSLLPMVDLPLSWGTPSDSTGDGKDDNIKRGEHTRIHYGPCIWIFFGRNSSNKSMSGRPLHTDSISHDGTWHYQLSGSKTWHLRPTQELLDIWSSDSSNAEGDDICEVQLPGKDEELTITCEEGDVILCNTRLWWHRTEISPTCGSISDNFSDGACTQKSYAPSVSYARDVYLDGSPAHEDNGESNGEVGGGMTNVDGLYAANDIEVETIVFTEEDMPDCELHRSTDPNCKVVELEDGGGAIVSIRDILSGEFFSIAESSDEEESDDDEEDEDDEEENVFICRKVPKCFL